MVHAKGTTARQEQCTAPECLAGSEQLLQHKARVELFLRLLAASLCRGDVEQGVQRLNGALNILLDQDLRANVTVSVQAYVVHPTEIARQRRPDKEEHLPSIMVEASFVEFAETMPDQSVIVVAGKWSGRNRGTRFGFPFVVAFERIKISRRGMPFGIGIGLYGEVHFSQPSSK